MHLSIAAPSYNEEKCIKQVIREWHTHLHQLSQITQFEIVICNDGSTDQTGFLLDELSLRYPQLKIIHSIKNMGAAAALATAISNTKYDWVLLTDSDGQFPIHNLNRMIDALKINSRSLSFSQGIRQKKGPLLFKLGSKASGFVCNIAHGTKIKDFNSAFKLVPGPILRSLTLEAKGMNYSTEITSRLLELRLIPIEVDIEHRDRLYGKSHAKLIKDGFHRVLFVSYIVLRQILFKVGILRRIYS